MKPVKKIAYLLLLLNLPIFILAQSKGKVKKGEKYFDGYSYSKAIEKYESFDKKTPEINRKLAQSYAKIGDTKKSEHYYSQLVNEENKNPEDVLGYASMLSMNGKYEESQTWMGVYHLIEGADSRGELHEKNPGYYEKLMVDKERFTIKNVSANSEQEDFGPSYYKDKVVFSSSREGVVSVKRTWNWNGLPFLDTYIATPSDDNELSEIKEFNKKINNKYHEGPVSFNKPGDFMVFTRNNYKGKSKEGVIKLQLFSSKLEGDTWGKEEAFPYNSDEYSVGHASLTPDGKTMYFASDMPGGKGGVDLYKTSMSVDGSWSKPENLGDKINTEGNEMFPFIHEGGEMLFFSSDGHLGLGGLDVFIAQVKNDGNFGKIENLGIPINGTKDDFSFILDSELKKGYFSSNRENGKGDDDIYSFNLLKPFTFGKTIKGVAKDKKGNILSETEVILFDDDGNEVEKVNTTEDGAYLFLVDPNKKFKLTGNKKKYFEGKNTADTETEEDIIIADLELEKDPGLSLYALITNKKTGEPLEGVKVTILDNMTGKEQNIITPVGGDYRRPLRDKKLNDRGSYNFKLAKKGFFTKTVTYNTLFDKAGQYDVHAELDLGMDPEVKDLANLIEINPINFDYNKYNIREDAAQELNKIVEVMNRYPGMVVELGSHTDSRGSERYNEKLSDRRAKASAAYIKKYITKPERIYGKGYGESKLLNRCSSFVECSEEEHAKNRRTEFKVISTGNDDVNVKNNSTDSFDN